MGGQFLFYQENEAIHRKNAATMNRQAETSLADKAILMKTSIETASG